VTAIEVWRETATHQPASVYRLVFPAGEPAVFAKHCDSVSGAVERSCYEEILPKVGVSSPAYFGSLEESDGSWWLFLEDIGRERFSAHDPLHRALASRWIGRLHRRGAELALGDRLPDAGATRYRTHLKEGRERILRNLANPSFVEDDRAVLHLVLTAQERVERRWEAIEQACARLPRTIVHGDFRPKNVRVRQDSGGAALYALDWELAGWGIPAADLAPARGSREILQVDPEVYLREGPLGLDHEMVARLSALGYLFRRIAAIDWDSASLHFRDPELLSGPVASLEVLHKALGQGLARVEEWLA
jgi:hypothetical protein